MSMNEEEPILHELLSRLAALELANDRLQEELKSMHADQVAAADQAGQQAPPRPRRSSRRKMLAKGLGVAAAATIGAGAMLEMGSGTAQASGPGSFSSSNSSVPAVKATGTKGAKGVVATSDTSIAVSGISTSGNGLYVQSKSGIGSHIIGGGATPSTPSFTEAAIFAEGGPGYGLYTSGSGSGDTLYAANSGTGTAIVAQSSGGLAGHFTGNVQMDNNLTVTGAASTGTLSSGAGIFTSSASGTPTVKATGTNGADGIDASSDSGNGVLGSSSSGTGVNGQGPTGVSGSGFNYGVSGTSDIGYAIYGSVSRTQGIAVVGNNAGGMAGLFNGNVTVSGNFSASGTKNFVQAHPSDPSKEIVYVSLEGGEAGTYVRGSGSLMNGKAVIALPEHFALVTASEGLTVHLTPRGGWLQLYAVELDRRQLVVREAQGLSGEFDYLIHGLRRGYEQHEVIRARREMPGAVGGSAS